jgi:hypothetical protein
LKRLRGTPIIRHDQSWQMVYSPHPPYELLRNSLLDFPAMQRLRRFARHWDLVGNSGNFIETTPLLWSGGASPFAAFLKWSEWLRARSPQSHGIALARLAGWLFEYLTAERGLAAAEIAPTLWRDWRRAGRREKPEFLAPYLTEADAPAPRAHPGAPKRQARHLAKAAAT